MRVWEDLVRNVIVGTDALPHAPEEAGGELGDLLARVAASTPEEALLSRAAAVSLWRRAGRAVPADASAAPPPAPPDDLPVAPAACESFLEAMLAGDRLQVLPEFLAALAASGRVLPHRWIPRAIESRVRLPDLPALIPPVLGARGRWLAELNPDWKDLFVLARDGEEAWENGMPAARRDWFAAFRRRDPAAARELLLKSWKKEPAQQRASFAAAFEHGLSMADEPFLEEALDDRGKEVRDAAAELLAALPESRFAGRMAERVGGAIRLRKKLLKSAFEIEPPDELDAPAKRDGLILPAPKEGKPQAGAKSHWLEGVAAAAPLSVWEAFGSPEENLALAAASDWKGPLRSGLKKAAIRQRRTDWLEALIATEKRPGPGELRDLVVALPPERRAPYLDAVVGKGRLSDTPGLWTDLLEGVPEDAARAAWGAAFDAVAERLGGKSNTWTLSATLAEFALRAPAAYLPDFTGKIARALEAAGDECPAESAARQAISTADFRCGMHAALATA